MSLRRDIYQALEDIVGPEYALVDEPFLDSYAFQWGTELFRPNGNKFMPRPEAVLLPGSAGEVQAIARVCNKHKIKYKAFSTGWSVYAAPYTEGQILLDMRRLDRILDIDEKNMFAVIEPNVIGATLQAEAMKVGLNTHIIGSGCVSSPLAAATSFLGHGPDSLFMGQAAENLLAAEWVLPTGDIVRTGSLGAGIGWFCGDGPGPSVRAIIRGGSGARGALGVFTKCAVKLYPWPGPAQLPVEGTIPAYHSPLPPQIKAYTIAFPDWGAYADAHYKIYDAEIGYILHRQYNKLGEDLGPAFFMMYIDPTKTIDDLEEMLERPEIKKLTEEMRVSTQIVLCGMTQGDIAWQERALGEILAETGGWKVAAMSDPMMEKFTLLYLIRLGFKGLNMVFSGGYRGSFSQKGTPDFAVGYRAQAASVLAKHQKTGLIVEAGGDSMMGPGGGMGGGGHIGFEQFCFYDPSDLASINAALDYFEDAAREAKRLGLTSGYEARIFEARLTEQEKRTAFLSAPQPALYRYQRQIKDIFDPNDLGDDQYAVMPKDRKGA
jgi:hypothetical protein